MTPTLVTFLLDRSGSMGAIRDDTIGAFNIYTGELKKTDSIQFSLLQFDSVSIDTTYKNMPISDVPPLTNDTFQPRASTPLIDACVKTIRAVETALKARDDKPQVVICFQTDGQENCSREHTWAELNDLIKEKSAEGWQFNFMGASIDAYAQATKMGLGAAQTMSYDSTNSVATKSAFAARGATTAMYASGALHDVTISAGEKLMAGDKFAPELKGSKEAPKSKQPVVDLGQAFPDKPKAIVDDPQL